jgi:hypothetical protein
VCKNPVCTVLPVCRSTSSAGPQAPTGAARSVLVYLTGTARTTAQCTAIAEWRLVQPGILPLGLGHLAASPAWAWATWLQRALTGASCHSLLEISGRSPGSHSLLAAKLRHTRKSRRKHSKVRELSSYESLKHRAAHTPRPLELTARRFCHSRLLPTGQKR